MMPLTSSCPARKGSHTPALCSAAAQLVPYQMDRGLLPASHTYCKKKKGGNSGGRWGRCTLLSVQASDVPLWERGPQCCHLERAGSYFPRVTDVAGESRRGLVGAPRTDHAEWGSASPSWGCLSSHVIPESRRPAPQVYTLSHLKTAHPSPVSPARLQKGGLLALIKGGKMLSSSSLPVCTA